MDVAGLIVNISLFVATGVATLIAWRQAVAARDSSATAAEAQREALDAQRQAVAAHRAAAAAQKAAADALAKTSDIAQSALDLETRKEAREREVRQVSWKCSWEYGVGDELVFRARNTGQTAAIGVTAVGVRPDLKPFMGTLGDIGPGEQAELQVGDAEEGSDAIELMLFRDTPYELHWSSPLGHPESHKHRGMQLY